MADDASELALVQRLRAGDEQAFTHVFERYHALLVRLALAIAKDAAAAEEVAQDAWVSALDHLDAFEGRSSLKTWLARIVVNGAKTRRARDARSASIADLDAGPSSEPAVDPSRFYSWGLWAGWPDRWDETPEGLVLRREVRVAIDDALASLPAAQRAVVTLRDIEGWTSEEVCESLDVTDTNQRVLLHRGRSRLRAALESALRREKTP